MTDLGGTASNLFNYELLTEQKYFRKIRQIFWNFIGNEGQLVIELY